MKKAKINKIKRVSKDQWFTKALDTLETSGVEAVKIEKLAKELGISRSGFYWHFKNRQNLLEKKCCPTGTDFPPAFPSSGQ